MNKLDILKVIKECCRISGYNVSLEISLQQKHNLIVFSFKWEDEKGGLFNRDYCIAEWEIDKFVGDINAVLIGKFEYETVFKELEEK